MANDTNTTMIHIETNAKSAGKELKAFGNTAKKTGNQFSAMQSKMKKTSNRFANMSNDLNRSRNGFKGLNAGLSTFNKLVGVGMAYKLGQQLGQAMQSAIDMIETVNLFNVSLGTMATQANETVNAMSDFYGLDATNLQNSIGTYALLARSMGFSAEQAEILSTSTAQLAVDLSSLTNVPVQQVMQDLRSGLVGQSETVYKYGIDVTEAGIKTEALAQGITKSVRNMSQGEKMALRYSAMLNQTGLAQGDFARTLEQPANQLKILGERFTTLSRSIGTLFIPMLSKVLPYLNAIVKYITAIIDGLAVLFGYEAPEIGGGISFDGVAESAKNAENAVGSLSNSLQSFDETHQLSTDSGSSGTGVGGASILDDMELEEYDSFMEQISEKTKEATEAVEEFFTSLSNKFKPITDELAKIDWESIRDGLVGLWDALKPYGSSFFDGVIEGIANLTGIAVEDLNELFEDGGAIDNLIQTLNDGDPDKIKSLGEAFVYLATAFALFKTGTAVAIGLETLSAGLSSIGGALSIIDNLGWTAFVLGTIELGIDEVEYQQELQDWFDGGMLGDMPSRYTTENGLAIDLIPHLDIDEDLNEKIDSWFKDHPISIPFELTDPNEGNDAVKNLNQDLLDSLTSFDGWAEEWKSDWGSLFEEIFGENSMLADAKNNLVDFADFISEVWEDDVAPIISDWWDNDVAPWFTVEKWSELVANSVIKLKEKFDEELDDWNVWKDWIDENVAPYFTLDYWIEIATGMKDGIIETFNNTIEALKEIWNNFADFLNEKLHIKTDALTIAGKEVAPALDYQLFEFPKFARGGVISNRSIIEVGENGAEAVMPLENNTEWITNLARQLSERGGAGSSTTDITLELNGKKFAQATIKDLEKEARRQCGLRVKLA